MREALAMEPARVTLVGFSSHIEDPIWVHDFAGERKQIRQLVKSGAVRAITC